MDEKPTTSAIQCTSDKSLEIKTLNRIWEPVSINIHSQMKSK
jgi:hypothetical protein